MAERTRLIGPISAYAIAKAEGYTGTKAEFADEIANASTNAQAAADSADDAAASVTAIEQMIGGLPNDFDDIIADLADVFDPNNVYQSGDVVNHSGQLYRRIFAGSGAWDEDEWYEMNIGDELAWLRSSVDSVAEQMGIIPYWANGEKTVGSTSPNIATVTQRGAYVTVNGRSSTSTNGYARFSLSGVVDGSVLNDATYTDNAAKTIPVKAGHNYRITVEEISGSYAVDGDGTLNFGVYIFESGVSGSKAQAKITTDGTHAPVSAIYKPDTDTNILVALMFKWKVTYTNFKIRVTLEDLGDFTAPTNGITQGEYFTVGYGKQLYQATKNINGGSIISPFTTGTSKNCNAISIADALNALRTQ